MQKIDKFKYLPFGDGQPFQLRMGLQPLPPEQWIEIGDDYAAQLAEKRRLLAARHGDVFQALPESRTASDEALQLLLEHLRTFHADHFAIDGTKLRNIQTGEIWDIENSPLHPLEQAGRLVQEDFCILQSDGAHYLLTAGSVCFPSNWRLADKIGRKLAEVHGPVPGYADRLERPVDRFFANLQADTIMWRANWLIHTTPALFQVAHAPTTETITSSNAGEKLWLRAERQTLHRLPESGAVLFTIRTHLAQLGQAICSRKSAQDLATAVRTMPDAVLHYRRLHAVRPALLDWLEAQAAHS